MKWYKYINVGINVFLEECPKDEVQGTDIGWEQNALSSFFLADMDIDRNNSSAMPGSF